MDDVTHFADTVQSSEAVLDNTNRNFKGQQKNEVISCFCRRHWIVLFPRVLLFAVAVGVSGILFVINQIFRPFGFYSVLPLAAIVIFTYSLHYLFIGIFNYYLQIMVVTNFRVIQLDQTLFFHIVRDSLDIREIQDITVNQSGFFATVLNYGEMVITLSSVSSTKVLRYVPNPEYHFRKINKTKREKPLN